MFGSWILPCQLHEALPFMSNIFMLRDTVKPFSPRTILQHTAVSRPHLTKCIASTSSVRSKLSRSIDSVFFLSFCGYHDLSHTRPLDYLVRRNGKFICLGIFGRLAVCACFYIYGSQLWFDDGLLPTSYLQNGRQVIVIFFVGRPSYGACLSYLWDLSSLEHFFALGLSALSSLCSR